MTTFIWPSILPYFLFSVFTFYQKRHLKYFQGASEAFHSLLLVSVSVATIVAVVYLGYYAWYISIWGAIAIFLMSIVVAGVGGFLVEKLIGQFTISVLGFLAWPLLAYLMFSHL